MLNKLKEKMETLRNTTEDAAVELLTNKVTPEIQAKRFNTCLSCDKLYKPTDTCKACGCFMRIKTWMPSVSCPLDKWGTEPNAK